jgi:hypothetical protein
MACQQAAAGGGRLAGCLMLAAEADRWLALLRCLLLRLN